MTKTAQELAQRVLERLRAVGEGQTASAASSQSVQNFYSNVYQELVVDDLAYWDEASIPEEAFEPLADLIAGRMAADFGMTRPDLEASGDFRLRKLASNNSSGLTVAGDYY